MAVFQNRPYERHMVSNISTLLAAGQPLSSLAVGQFGIFDAKTNLSVTAPTYQINKAIYIAQGTPDRSNYVEGAGIPNIVRKTHLIRGKSLLSLRGKKANIGQTEIVTLGFDGVDVSKTLTAKPGETFYYWVRLTGDPIFNLNPDRSKGVIIQGAVQMPCADDCADNCTTVDCQTIVNKIVDDWHGVLDPQSQKIVGGKFLPGGEPVRNYVDVGPLVKCATNPAYTITQYDQFTLTIADDGSESALGVVQSQYPGLGVIRQSRTGIFSTYSLVQLSTASAPAAFVQPEGTVVPNCSTCPESGTLHPGLAVFHITGTSATQAVNIDNALATYDPVVVTILQTDALTGVTTYQVTTLLGTTQAQVATAVSGVTGYLSTSFVGNSAPYCVLPSTTTAWDESEHYCNSVQVQFTITVKDNSCTGNCASTLADLQAAYASIATDYGTVAGTVAITTSGTCSCVFTLTTQSNNCVPENCQPEEVVFPLISDWKGEAWTPVALPVGVTPCVCGLQFFQTYTPRVTKECTFDQFAYQTDWIHIEASSHNPDWRSTDLCEVDPIATRIQNGAYPNGNGQAVARLEKQDRMYDMDYFYMSPVLREAFDFFFETQFDQYYDMVAVEYDYQYSSNNGFGQTDNDRYIQYFWLPTTQAGQLVTALNTYAASANINIDPIVL